jgi:hypothetical protein
MNGILFTKDHYIEEDVDAVLISFESGKAFDAASPQCPESILNYYGFGSHFINCFETLYCKISVKILINGHLSESINTERGYKLKMP